VRHDEHDRVEVAACLELVRSRCDGKAKRAVKTGREIPRPLRPVRHFGRSSPDSSGSGVWESTIVSIMARMSVSRGEAACSISLASTSRSISRTWRPCKAANMAPLSGKILVDRADADACELNATAFENPDDGVENGLNRLTRPSLPRLAPAMATTANGVLK
jgi:hypothetical protein